MMTWQVFSLIDANGDGFLQKAELVRAHCWLKGSGFDEVCPPNGSYRLLSPPSSLALSLGAMSRRCGGSGASMMVRIGDFGGGGTVEEHTPTNFVVDLDFPAVYRALQGEQSRSGHLKSTQCAEVMLLHVRLTAPLPRGIPKVHVVSGGAYVSSCAPHSSVVAQPLS